MNFFEINAVVMMIALIGVTIWGLKPINDSVKRHLN